MISKGSKTNLFSSFWPETPFLISPYYTTFIAHDILSYSPLGQFVQCSIYAGNEVCMLPFLNGCRSQNPLCMAMSQDSIQPLTYRILLHRCHKKKTWKFFNPSECLTDMHFVTHKKTTFFLLYFWDFLPLCKLRIILVLVLTVFLDREKMNLLLNMQDITSTNKENMKAKKNFYYFNKQKNIFYSCFVQ